MSETRASNSLRRMIAESHIAAVAIAFLLIWSLHSAFQALWIPLSNLLEVLGTAVAILGIPYSTDLFRGTYDVIVFGTYAASALIDLAAAYVIARVIYGTGPMRCLVATGNKIVRRANVSSA